MLVEQIKHFLTILGSVDDVAELFERVDDNLAVHRLVVGDQNARRLYGVNDLIFAAQARCIAALRR